MCQGESHSHQGHGGSDISQICDGGLDEIRKLDAQKDHQQGGGAGRGAGVYHGLQGGEGKASVHQRNAVGVEDEGIYQQELRHVDYILFPKDAGYHRDADKAQVGEDKHHLEDFSLLGFSVKETGQQHAHCDKDSEHAQGDKAHNAHGFQGDQPYGIGAA